MVDFVLTKEAAQQVLGMTREAAAGNATHMQIFVPMLQQLCECFLTAHDEIMRLTISTALPGGRAMWFDRDTLPPRDKLGYTDHPDTWLRIWFDGDPADEAPMSKQAFEEMGLELYIDHGGDEMERYDNWNRETHDFNDSEEGGCTKWTPTPPAGDGWRLASIYDTEDGPAAMWVRERPALPVDQEVSEPT